MKDANWDQKIWSMATNPWILALTALTQWKSLAEMLRGGDEISTVILVRWFLPLACTVILATLVAFWGTRNFWSLTRIVLIGFGVVMAAQPFIGTYVNLIAQSA